MDILLYSEADQNHNYFIPWRFCSWLGSYRLLRQNVQHLVAIYSHWSLTMLEMFSTEIRWNFQNNVGEARTFWQTKWIWWLPMAGCLAFQINSHWSSSTGHTVVSKFKSRLPAQRRVGTHRKGPSRMEKVTSRMNWPIRNWTQIRN